MVVIQGDNGKVFGGYNDIGWFGKDKVSTNKKHEKKSFLFFSKESLNNVEDIDVTDTEIFEHRRCKGEFEIFHSDQAGPHFIDLKVKGPNDRSSIRTGKNYQLQEGQLTDAEADQHGKQLFRYVMYEVYEAEAIPETEP